MKPRLALAMLAVCIVSACATPRLHKQADLNDVGRSCGLALGEVFQDESEKKLLFVLAPMATAAQRACIVRWAKRNRLKAVIVDNIKFEDS